MKRIAARYFPRRLVYSRKRPWDLPWHTYLAPLARRSLFRDGVCAEALGLNTLALDELLTSWHTNVDLFWNMLNLELWGRLFLRGDSVERAHALVAEATHAHRREAAETPATS